METIKRGRGRPKGSKNKAPGTRAGQTASEESHDVLLERDRCGLGSGPVPVPGTQRAALEADRDRLLKSIAEAAQHECPHCHRGGDPKIEAALQSQLNGVNRMLLRISGETAPSDTNLIRSPQWSRLKAKLFDTLSKKHPAAWAAVLEIEAEG